MAVVQISRIQIRRGQKNSGTGLPQLASGEMAWAVDTQELYIGNGAVSEGSPAVGNTKIVTSKDLESNNLFGVVQYVYKIDDNITVQDNAPVTRTVQERLDDSVNTTDFGTIGDYNPTTNLGADDTNALQFAINQLFLNATSKASGAGPSSISARVILQLPAGTFRLRSTLYVPSYASLIGAGADKSIIYYDPITTSLSGVITQNAGTTMIISPDFTSDMVGSYITGTNITNTDTTIVSVIEGASAVVSEILTSATSGTFTVTPKAPAIQFVNDTSSIGSPSSIESTLGVTQPRNVQVSGLTIHDVSGFNTCLQLDAVKNSLFEDLYLIGTLDGAYDSFSTSSAGIAMNVQSTLVTTENNIFRNIKFNGFSYDVYAKGDVVNNIFENCYLTDSLYGFAMGVGANGFSDGQTYGPRSTQIVNSKFYDIKWNGVICPNGQANSVNGCSFINVGVDGASNTHSGNDIVRYPQVYFGNHGNMVHNIKSDRADDLEDSHFDITYIPAVTGRGVYNSNATRSIYLGTVGEDFLRLPVATDAFGVPDGSMMYTVDYVLQNKAVGSKFNRTGTLIISADIDEIKIQLSDEYNYAGIDTGIADIAIRLDFIATLLDVEGNDASVSGNPPFSIMISYTNETYTLDGYFTYSYKTII